MVGATSVRIRAGYIFFCCLAVGSVESLKVCCFGDWDLCLSYKLIFREKRVCRIRVGPHSDCES
jgi:hypothetical protein